MENTGSMDDKLKELWEQFNEKNKLYTQTFDTKLLKECEDILKEIIGISRPPYPFPPYTSSGQPNDNSFAENYFKSIK